MLREVEEPDDLQVVEVAIADVPLGHPRCAVRRSSRSLRPQTAEDWTGCALDAEGLRRLKDLAKREKKEVSAVARELMDYGWTFPMLREYRGGKRPLGSLADALEVSLTEAIDLLTDLGVRSSLEYDDYLKGYAAARELVAEHKGG